MKNLLMLSSVLVLVLALAVATPARAAIALYTDPVNFQTAASSATFTLLNFDNLADASPWYTYYGQSAAMGGVQFSVPDNLSATNPNYGSGYDYLLGSYSLGTALTSYANTPTETAGNGYYVTLPAGVTALGFFLGNTFAGGSAPGSFTFQFSDGSQFVETPTPGTAAFYGFVSGTPIANLKIFNSTPSVNASDTALTNLMRFEYAVSPVPEPAEWPLMGAGLALLGLRRRRQAKRRPPPHPSFAAPEAA